MVDSYVFVEYRKSYNIFNVAILLLLHLMCLVEFLLDILYFILKIVYIYIYILVILLQIIISTIKFLIDLSFLGKLLIYLADHL